MFRLRASAVVVRLACVAALIGLLAASVPWHVHAADAAWRGEYFNNPNLAGNPVFVRSDNDINFNWDLGSPGAGIPADYFSVRWSRSVYLGAGQWTFNATVDDGVRVYLDGQLIIDQWHISAPNTYSATRSLGAGDHMLWVQYFENTERAQIRVWWNQGSAPPPPPPPAADGWSGSYYDNRDLNGNPRFTRTDAAINFNWGEGGPGGGIGGQNYSVRWTRTQYFQGGPYQLRVTVDDGVRVFLDNNLMIDQWKESSAKTYTRDVDIGNGNHTTRVEYFQAGGGAQIQYTAQLANVDWKGNLITCMALQNSWVKVYRLTPNRQWEDMNPQGWGPIGSDGSRKIDGLPIDSYYGTAGQPYKVELWVNSKITATDGDISEGQPEFRIRPSQDAHTTWPCGDAIPQAGHGPPEN